MPERIRHRLEIKSCGKIRDIQKREDLQLITDSQDVQAVKENIGMAAALEEFDGLFVNVSEGEYKEIYGFHGTVPTLEKDLFCISRVWVQGDKEIRRDQVCRCPEK